MPSTSCNDPFSDEVHEKDSKLMEHSDILCFGGKQKQSRKKVREHIPADNYMFNVKNKNTRTRCEICLS